MLDFEDEAHEIWAMAQLLPNECILDGVSRIKKKLEELAQQTNNSKSEPCEQLYECCAIDGRQCSVNGKCNHEK